MQIDFNLVGAMSLVLAGFGYFVRLTIKSAIADLKDALGVVYMGRSELEVRLGHVMQRIETLETTVSEYLHHAN